MNHLAKNFCSQEADVLMGWLRWAGGAPAVPSSGPGVAWGALDRFYDPGAIRALSGILAGWGGVAGLAAPDGKYFWYLMEI